MLIIVTLFMFIINFFFLIIITRSCDFWICYVSLSVVRRKKKGKICSFLDKPKFMCFQYGFICNCKKSHMLKNTPYWFWHGSLKITRFLQYTAATQNTVIILHISKSRSRERERGNGGKLSNEWRRWCSQLRQKLPIPGNHGSYKITSINPTFTCV